MIVSVWLKCLIIRVSGVAMVGIPQARLSLCVHVLMHVCVALSPQQNRKSAGKERDCDLMCVCGQFTLTLPHKRLLWLIRGRRETDPSIHPPIHPPTHLPSMGWGPSEWARRSTARPEGLQPAGVAAWKSIKADERGNELMGRAGGRTRVPWGIQQRTEMSCVEGPTLKINLNQRF